MPKSSAHHVAVTDAPQNSQRGTGFEVYSKDPGYVIAVAGKYLVQVNRGRMTSTTVSLMRRALTDLSERHEKFGYLAILEPDFDLLMSPDIRTGTNAVIKRFSPRLAGAAIVFEKTGFHATAVRSVVTAINVASRATHPNHVFSDLQEAVSWLNKLTAGEPTVGRLLHIAKQLRASLTHAAE